jgi:alpha-beta hydrolase superfamily lysophospholipase
MDASDSNRKGIAMSNGTVRSTDGTMIAYESQGSGDPVIVVNTVAEDRSGLSGLAGLLAERFTVYTYDRRGRGESGDTKPYAPRREVEDLTALIETAGERVDLISGSADYLEHLECRPKLLCWWRSVETASVISMTGPAPWPNSCRR